MDRSKGLLLVLLASLLGGCASAKRPARTFPAVVEARIRPEFASCVPFRLGERLTYDVYYGLIHAGKATLVVEDIVEVGGRPTYHVVLTAKSSSGFSKILPVDDRIETYIDTEEFIPRKFAKNLKEGDYRCNEETILDQENHRGHYLSLRSGRTKEYDLPERCQDTLSLFYFLRLVPLTVGEEFLVKVMADEELWDVGMRVERRERKTVYRGGSFDSYLLYSDAAFDSGSLRKGTGRIWISADEQRRPVLIKTRLTFGHLTLALVEADNTHEGGEEETCVARRD